MVPVVKSKVRGRGAALLAASVTVMFTAACGGSGDSGTASTPAGENAGGGNSAFTAYVSCLNENGVTIAMPSGRAGGQPGARPSGAPGAGGPGALPSGQPRPSGSAGQRGGGFPGGGGFSRPEGVDDATWAKAQSACASLRPSTGAGMGAGRGNQGGGGATAAYTNCLTENGVTDTANLDTTDATVKKAVETCAVLKPTAAATS